MGDGLDAFKDRLNGACDEPNDLIEFGGQNTVPIDQEEFTRYTFDKVLVFNS